MSREGHSSRALIRRKELTPRLFFLVSSWQLPEPELVPEWPNENMSSTSAAHAHQQRPGGRPTAEERQGARAARPLGRVRESRMQPGCGHVSGRRSPPPLHPAPLTLGTTRRRSPSPSCWPYVVAWRACCVPTARRHASQAAAAAHSPPNCSREEPLSHAACGEGPRTVGRVFRQPRHNGRERGRPPLGPALADLGEEGERSVSKRALRITRGATQNEKNRRQNPGDGGLESAVRAILVSVSHGRCYCC